LIKYSKYIIYFILMSIFVFNFLKWNEALVHAASSYVITDDTNNSVVEEDEELYTDDTINITDIIVNTTMNTTNIIENTTNVTGNTTNIIENTTNVIENTTNLTLNTTQPIGNTPILIVPNYQIVELGNQIDARSLIIEASDVEDGNDLRDRVVISGDVNFLKVGKYHVTYSLTDSDGNIAVSVCVITVKGKDTVVIGDNAIDAQDFSINRSEMMSMTDADIINRAKITAWNIPNGSDLMSAIQIDKSDLRETAGQYKIRIRINSLLAILGKDNAGNDVAIINVNVQDDNTSYINSTNNSLINNNSTNMNSTNYPGSLPATGEKSSDFYEFCKEHQY